MKAKLIKSDIQYRLHNEEGIVIATSLENGKLSIKNCEAIANGYDLDELADEYATGKSSSDVFKNTHQKDFTKGFQKALEILGDKKFSEEDMINFAEYCKGDLMKTKDLFNEYHSLQQTEWDVEVEQELIQSSIQGEAIWKLKLDEEGCLILKRIWKII